MGAAPEDVARSSLSLKHQAAIPDAQQAAQGPVVTNGHEA